MVALANGLLLINGMIFLSIRVLRTSIQPQRGAWRITQTG
jgi:hypothetical protein